MNLEAARKSKPFENLIALDIETGSNGQLLDIGIFDGEDFFCFPNWRAFIHHMNIRTERKFCNWRVIAHNGINFDYVGLLLDIAKNSEAYDIDIDNDIIILSAESIVVGFILKLGKARISFVDTMRFFPGLSLEKVACSMLGLSEAKNKIPDDYISRMQAYKRKHRKLYYSYLKNDCVLLYKSYEKFRDEINDLYPIGELGWSSGSTSLNSFRCHLRKYDEARIFGLPSEHWEMAKNAYRGGFVAYIGDVDKDQHNDFYTDVFHYDFNSMYPSVMKNIPAPTSPLIHRKKINIDKGLPYGIYRADFKQQKGRIPLCFASKDTKPEYPSWEAKDTWLTTFDLMFLSEYGDFTIKEALVYEYQDYYFTDYIETLWSERLKAKKSDNGARSLALKILLNSLYGKMGAHPIGEKIAISSDLDYYRDFRATENIALASDLSFFKKYGYCLIATPDIRSGFSNQVIAALVTAGARIKLGMMLNACKSIYCDTDSVFTTTRIPDRFISDEMGYLDSDLKQASMICVGKKQYLYGEDKIASKGVPQKNLSRDTFLKMAANESVRINYRSPSPLRSALNKAMDNPNRFEERFRTIKRSASMFERGLIKQANDRFSFKDVESFYHCCAF